MYLYIQTKASYKNDYEAMRMIDEQRLYIYAM